jgi:queuine tRNA-ribosyltransferase
MPQKDLRFELLAVDGAARRARFRTDHGPPVETPAFMPVGTQGAVKALTPDQVAETGAQVVLANTFHLSLEDRRELVKRQGGLHKFMAWDRTILTDSGGFQVFSLPDKDITDEGVTFRWEKDGSPTYLDPERSMDIQRDLGADIVMAFDECAPHDAARAYTIKALERTTRWAARCRKFPLAPHQYLFGIVQGGIHEDLRARSAREITAIDFDGFAIGGVSVGEGFDLMTKIVRWTTPLLPAKLPRYLMGVGLPEDILSAVEHGVDMFDCVIPTRYGRGGTLFARTGKVRVTDKRYRKDKYPIDTKCGCYTCARFSRLVLRHLYYAREPLFETLASIHNVHFYQDLMRDIRAAIEERRFATFKAEWLARYGRGGDAAPSLREDVE